jgi:hypothetical protein
MDILIYAKSWLNRLYPWGYPDDKIVLTKLTIELEELRNAFDNPIAYARINERGDLFDLRLQANPYTPNLVPLYLRPDYATQRQQAMQSHSQKSQS